MSVKEDDVLRFVSALGVFAILPPHPPEQDNPVPVLGVMCIIQAVDRMLSIPFPDPQMEAVRTSLRKKLDDIRLAAPLPAELFEQAGRAMAMEAGLWIAAYVNTIIDRAGDEPYAIALELSKGSTPRSATKEHNHGNA